MKQKLTDEQREARTNARWKIIQEANRHKMRSRMHPYHYPTLFGMKNLNRAVFYVRQHLVVSGKLLQDAGFRPRALKPGKPGVLKKMLGE
jgi:hypothetical protein